MISLSAKGEGPGFQVVWLGDHANETVRITRNYSTRLSLVFQHNSDTSIGQGSLHIIGRKRLRIVLILSIGRFSRDVALFRPVPGKECNVLCAVSEKFAEPRLQGK